MSRPPLRRRSPYDARGGRSAADAEHPDRARGRMVARGPAGDLARSPSRNAPPASSSRTGEVHRGRRCGSPTPASAVGLPVTAAVGGTRPGRRRAARDDHAAQPNWPRPRPRRPRGEALGSRPRAPRALHGRAEPPPATSRGRSDCCGARRPSCRRAALSIRAMRSGASCAGSARAPNHGARPPARRRASPRSRAVSGRSPSRGPAKDEPGDRLRVYRAENIESTLQAFFELGVSSRREVAAIVERQRAG